MNNPNEEEILQQCEEHLGYHFKDRSLLRAALTHSSKANNRIESNERLEFLGDAILGIIVCEELYRRFPNLLEGAMTKIKSDVVSGQSCAVIAKKLGMSEFILVGKGMPDRSNLPQSLLAGIFESLIAAIYLDSDLETIQKLVLGLVTNLIDESSKSEFLGNHKSQLQQYAQRKYGQPPLYELLDEKGPDHDKCFEICVILGHKSYPPAWGPNKKEAEQKAAKLALEELGLMG